MDSDYASFSMPLLSQDDDMDLAKYKMEMQELEKKRLQQLAILEQKRLNAAGVTGSLFKVNKSAEA